MLAVPIIFLSTILGIVGAPLWGAIACGAALAFTVFCERSPNLSHARSLGCSSAAVSAIATSLAIAQVASVGTFAVGRLLGELFA